MKTTPNIEELNGYVDGELSAAAATRVAMEAAADPQTASSIATLHRVKSALESAYMQDAVVISPPGPPQRRSLAKAACLAMAGGLGLLAAVWGVQLGGTFLQNTKPVADDAAPATTAPLAWTAEISADFRLGTPDISAAGLVPAFVESAHAANGEAVTHVAYVGRHGCRLSLYAADHSATGEITDFFPETGLLVADWSSASARYFAVAKGMDSTRFAIITAALEEATTRPEPLSGRLQVALAKAHQPCAS